MIEIINLHKKFGQQEVLRGVDLKIPSGQTMALIGGSGKGKSVLLKHIIGLLKPDSGKVLIDNLDISSLWGKNLKDLKDRCGIVFQGGALFDSLSVYDNVAFPLREKTRLSPGEINKRVLTELDSVGLKSDQNKFPAQLSGGMKKRVALARCLVMNPQIILFDEPTTGLDPMTTKSIHNLIKSLQSKRHLSALIVSHEIPEIFNIVDQVAMLHNGRIITTGTPAEFQQSQNPIVQQFLHGELQ